MVRANRAWLLAAGAIFLAPLGVLPASVGAPAPMVASDDAADWATRIWEASIRGDQATIDQLLANRPEGVDADGRLSKAVALLKTNTEAREIKRGEEIKRVNKELDRALAEFRANPKSAEAVLRAAKAAGYDAWLAGRVKKDGARKAVEVPSFGLTFEGDTLQVR